GEPCGVKRRHAKNYPVHKQVHTEAIKNAADDRVRNHESNHATGEVINSRSCSSDEKMKEEAERRRLNSASPRVLRAHKSTGNGLEHGRRRHANPQVIEN